MTDHQPIAIAPPQITTAAVRRNQRLCEDHYRLTLGVARFAKALPGQFVQLSPPAPGDEVTDRVAGEGSAAARPAPPGGASGSSLPFLPRAFSIAGLRRSPEACEIDVIYRVVGVATQWLASRAAGAAVTLLGPLGRPFPVSKAKREALLVVGGVGLPPLLWLAEALGGAGKRTVALLGARRSALIPLEMIASAPPCREARKPSPSAVEFAATGTGVIIATDDGSCGYHGSVVEALEAYGAANRINAADTVVYTCGPERMMQATTVFCLRRDIECHLCMERAMACGMGTCQSCVVTVKSDRHDDGQRYALCCTEGPVFAAVQVVWDEAARMKTRYGGP